MAERAWGGGIETFEDETRDEFRLQARLEPIRKRIAELDDSEEKQGGTGMSLEAAEATGIRFVLSTLGITL